MVKATDSARHHFLYYYESDVTAMRMGPWKIHMVTREHCYDTLTIGCFSSTFAAIHSRATTTRTRPSKGYGTGVLKVDGKVVAEQNMERTTPLILQWDESLDIGSDTLTGVDDRVRGDSTGPIDCELRRSRRFDWVCEMLAACSTRPPSRACRIFRVLLAVVLLGG